jgi:hypothetical protein
MHKAPLALANNGILYVGRVKQTFDEAKQQPYQLVNIF